MVQTELVLNFLNQCGIDLTFDRRPVVLKLVIFDGHKQNTNSFPSCLSEERAHIDEYIQKAAARKKELEK